MKSKGLQQLWWDWLATSERMLRSLHEQTAALTLRDVDRVQRIQPELDALLVRMGEIDQQAVESARVLSEELGAEPNLNGLIACLDKTEGQQLRQLANRVTVAARHVQSVIEKNAALIHSEMEFIHGSVALIANAVKESQGAFAQVACAAVAVNKVA